MQGEEKNAIPGGESSSPENKPASGGLRLASIYIGIAVLLFLSWVVPPTAGLWERLDLWFFEVSNRTLETWGEWWSYVVAQVNRRITDVWVALFYAALCAWFCLQDRGKNIDRRATELFLLLVVLLLFRFTFKIISNSIEYDRPSPTLVVDGAVLVSQIHTDFRTKDTSRSSFPSDHALVAFWVGLYFFTRGNLTIRIAIIVLTIVASLPRLLSGAHWLTDLVVGSLATTLIFYGLFAGTRFFDWMCDHAQPWISRLTTPFQRLVFGNKPP